ncbi:LysM peptidoglycan-binding domain-containing protein [Bacillus sp. A301a_S52]|nr:LysM peptidoglycan-binding domain-containing protein [Bacillus sp. A301a_S52]
MKKIIPSLLALGLVLPLFGSVTEAQSVHSVESGDTLWSISQSYEVSLSELIEENDLFKPFTIQTGQELSIPTSSPELTSNEVKQEADSSLSEFEQEVIRLTNEERESRGLDSFDIAEDVSEVARVKSEDMRDDDYFSHTSPTYGSPFDMLRSFDISYRSAGENIAAGQATPEQVVNSWMNSPGHRANILNSDFTHIGVGYAEGGSYRHYWTQMFISQ